jgi:acetyl esterase/lipase
MTRRRFFSLFAALVAVLLFGAVRMLTAGAAVPKGVVLEPAITYGQGGSEPLLLDLTRPEQGKGPFPAIVFVHGGGWTGGGRNDFRPQMYLFSQAGIVCVSLDYRLAPKHTFPAQLEDVKCGVRWVRAHAKEYHVDPARIAAFGASAGAHLVGLLGTTGADRRWEGKGGNPEQSSAICAMVCLAGPFDLPLGYAHSYRQNPQEGAAVRGVLEGFLGGAPGEAAARYRDASPVTYVSKTSAPSLLAHGTADPLVLIEQTELFSKKLQDAGVETELVRIEGGKHSDFGKDPAQVNARIAAFLRKHLLP